MRQRYVDFVPPSALGLSLITPAAIETPPINVTMIAMVTTTTLGIPKRIALTACTLASSTRTIANSER